MAKSSITNISTTNTFQVWFDKTNELVNLVKSDILTASLATANGDITVGNATLQGNFTATNATVGTLLRVDSISPKTGSTAVGVSAPVNITTNQVVLNKLTSTSGPRISLFNSGDTDWQVGFENSSTKKFIITNGAGTLKLDTSGNLELSGIFTGTAASVTNGVYTIGNQTINGLKTFKNALIVENNANVFTDFFQGKTGTLASGNPLLYLKKTSNTAFAIGGFNGTAQEGTLALNFSSITASGPISANITGNVTGNLNGNVTGNLTGNVTGNITGNAGTVTNGVYTTGSQSIGGLKTFTSPITVSTNTPYISLQDTIGGGADWRMVVGSSAFVLQTDADNYATNKLLINSSGNLIVTGDVTAFSDERLKTNIRTIDSALDKVVALRGVSFEKEGRSSIGVIAQEVEKVIPEVVHDGEYKSVAYGNLVGLLIEAIKELKSELDEIKGR